MLKSTIIVNVKSFIVYLLLLISIEVIAQDYNLRFEHITTNNGLSQNMVLSIAQDTKGFMWFATDYGLNRYDGYKFEHYYNISEDTTSLADNFVKKVFIDRIGNMWVNTEGYVHLYNPQANNFTRYKLPITKLQHKNVKFTTFFEDSDGEFWIGNMRGGLFRFDPKTKKAKNLYKVIGDIGITSIFQDNDGIIWIGADSGVLFKYDKKNNIVKKYQIPQKSVYHDLFLWFIENESENVLHIGTAKSLYSFDKTSGIFSRQNLNGVNKEIINFNCTYVDSTGYRFYGTLGDGLFVVTEGKVVKLKLDPNNKWSISNNDVIDIFRDRSGIFWIATERGINKFVPDNNHFSHYQNNPNYKNTLSFNGVTSFTEDKSGNIWIGTTGDGINIFNPRTKQFSKLETITKDMPDCISSVVFDITTINKNIWIAANSTLVQYNHQSKHFLTFNHDNYNKERPNKLINHSIKSLANGVNNDLWIGISGGGISHLYFDLAQNSYKFINYVNIKGDDNSLINNNIRKIFVDHSGVVWIGTSGFGLDRFDPKTHSFTHFIHHKNNKSGLTNNYITELYEDSNKTLWVGTNNGLNKFDKIKNTFIEIRNIDDLPYTMIRNIYIDNDSILWIASKNGLSRHNLQTGRVKKFDDNNAPLMNSFNYNAFYVAADNSIYTGGVNGFSVFKTSDIVVDTIPPLSVFTNLWVNNILVNIGDTIGNEVILRKNFSETDSITLNSKIKIFTIEFSALHFSSPERNRYRYKLEGFDNNWISTTSDNRKVTYSTLPAGEYTLKVQGANMDGVWSDLLLNLHINIIQPWWKTKVAITAFILFFALLVFVIFRLRVKLLIRNKETLEKIVQERTEKIKHQNKNLLELTDSLENSKEEVKTQYEELILYKNHLEELVETRTTKLKSALLKAEESDKLKSAFLANMSHEIRTPMNAIVGFSSLLKSNDLSKTDQDSYIDIIIENTGDLLLLIDDILDLSQIESDRLTIHKQAFYINELLDNLYSWFYLDNKNLNLKIILNNKLHINNIKFFTDRLRFRQILTNLMQNAVKFTHEGLVELRLEIIDERFVFSVKDTGIGIPSSAIETIFDRFVKNENENQSFVKGAGLGLSISKRLAQFLGGELTVESEVGKGSIFYFTVPIQHFKTDKEILIDVNNKHIPSNWNNINILIAEDERTNYLFLEKAIEPTGAKITWAKNGLEAIDYYNSNEFDIVLMDIKMPEMNGYEALKIIKEKNPEQIIIAQTAFAKTKDIINLQKAGFDDTLSKPIKLEALYYCLKVYISQ